MSEGKKVHFSKGTWRTLNTDEWQYLFNNHERKLVTVFDIIGYAVAPDGVTTDAIADSYSDESAWKAAEDAGIVFFPAAGIRIKAGINYFYYMGLYWSSSVRSEDRAIACSVRLVTEAE